MAYTEIKKKNNKRYFYRVRTLRQGQKFKKKRIYLGVDLDKEKLFSQERIADKKLNPQKELKQIEKIKFDIIEILKENKVKKAGIFGSYAKNKQKKDSDIDIIIQPPQGMGLAFVDILFELEKKLNKKVDLVTYKSLHPLIRKKVLEEEIKII